MRLLHEGNTKTVMFGRLALWGALSVLSMFLFASQQQARSLSPFAHRYSRTDTIPEKTRTGVDSLREDFVKSATRSDSLKPIPSFADTRPASDTLSFPVSPDSLTAPVHYRAKDSIVYDVPSGQLLLYGAESQVRYSGNELTAPYIQFDRGGNELSAYLQRDSTGKVIAYPAFEQEGFKSVSDTIRFNMKTGRGLTKGTYTQQGEMFVYGERIKKVDPDVFYAGHGRFTSCNLDTPHFAFVSSKIKFINKKVAFTGPVHPEIEGVPLPIVLPFGVYPLRQGRHSGLIAPNFTANEQLGLAMEGLGYYKILNDNWDVVARGTLYSYGGWTFNLNPRYFRKYRYQGNFSFDIQRFKTGFKGDPDYSSSQTFNIRWSHSMDSKARPGVTFSANVNAGSSRFNAQVPNSPTRNFTNQLNSSITYARTWKDKPYNISISANHNQNTTLRLINLNLPDIAFNLNTQYPFRRKEVAGAYKWYENIGLALNTNTRGLTSFYDTARDIGKQLLDNFDWGAQHSVPVTLSLPSLGALQIAPGMTYQERWYEEKFTRRWNATDRKVDTVIQRGFYTARDMGFSVALTTRIFGMFAFGRKSRVQAIRHEIRPTLSVNYKPNMNQRSYYTTQVDTTGRTAQYSYFERSVYGSFSNSRFGGLSFGIDNILQMKVKNRKDTSAQAVKKVSLIDGLGINGSYNFLADSFKLSTLSLNARSNLFDKVNITANATFDPYEYDASGRRIDRLVWASRPLSLGQLTGGGISLQSRFSGGNQESGNTSNAPARRPNASPLEPLGPEEDAEAAFIRNNPGDYVDFNVPWSADVAYSLRFSRTPSLTNPGSFLTTFSQDLNVNGSINLTPKWKVGLSGSYNITQKELGVLTLNLSRDLHCWQMTMTISPVGRYRFFTININPKSSLLRDIRVNRTRYFFDL